MLPLRATWHISDTQSYTDRAIRTAALVAALVVGAAGGGPAATAHGDAGPSLRSCAAAWNQTSPLQARRMLAVSPGRSAYVTTGIATAATIAAKGRTSCAVLFTLSSGSQMLATGVWTKGAVASWSCRWLGKSTVVPPPPNARVSGNWILHLDA